MLWEQDIVFSVWVRVHLEINTSIQENIVYVQFTIQCTFKYDKKAYNQHFYSEYYNQFMM